jgi:hypothetical protein
MEFPLQQFNGDVKLRSSDLVVHEVVQNVLDKVRAKGWTGTIMLTVRCSKGGVNSTEPQYLVDWSKTF